MADLMTALRNADAAGDTEAANRIAAMIRSQQPTEQAATGDPQRAYAIPDETPISPEEKAELFPRFSTEEQLAAVPQTALSMATGATSGALGYGAGSAVGALGDLAGVLSPEEAQDLANRWASTLTYEPDSEASKQQLAKISETLGVLPAVMGSAPMAGSRAGALQSAKAQLRPERVVTPQSIETAKTFARQGFEPSMYKDIGEAQKREQLTRAMASGDRQKVAAMIDADPEISKAAKDLGLQEQGLPSARSRNQQYMETEQALKKMSGSELSKIETNAITELQQKADSLIEEYGGRLDKSELSMDLAKRSQKSIDELGDIASTAYDDINKAIPRATRSELNTTGAALRQELQDLGGDMDQLSPLEKRLLKMSENPNTTYAAIDKVRKEVGETIGKQSDKFKSESSGTLKRIYRNLTEDQEVVANNAGMGDSWEAAKDIVKQRKRLEDNAVQMFGKNLSDSFMPKIGQSMKKLSTGDYKKFFEQINAVPKKQRQEVVISALNDAFTMGSRKEKQMSVAGFSDWYNGLSKNSKLKNTLYQYLPRELSKSIDDMGKVANGIRKAQAAAPVGGQVMASQNVVGKILDGVGSRFLSKMPSLIGGVVNAGLEKSKTKGVDTAIDVLSDPDFTKNIEAIARGQEKKAEAIEKRLMKKKKVADFMDTLSTPESESLASLGLMGWLSQQSEGDEPQN